MLGFIGNRSPSTPGADELDIDELLAAIGVRVILYSLPPYVKVTTTGSSDFASTASPISVKDTEYPLRSDDILTFPPAPIVTLASLPAVFAISTPSATTVSLKIVPSALLNVTAFANTSGVSVTTKFVATSVAGVDEDEEDTEEDTDEDPSPELLLLLPHPVIDSVKNAAAAALIKIVFRFINHFSF
jgi:hypothetical protein